VYDSALAEGFAVNMAAIMEKRPNRKNPPYLCMGSVLRNVFICGAMLRPAPYLSQKSTRPVPTEDRGTRRTAPINAPPLVCDEMSGSN
jgi:hypothetical protein